jgi:hypothetical protein
MYVEILTTNIKDRKILIIYKNDSCQCNEMKTEQCRGYIQAKRSEMMSGD